MKLTTKKRISEAYKSIYSLLIQIEKMQEMGFNTSSLETNTETALADLVLFLECLPVNSDYPTRMRLNMVLEDSTWVAVDSLTENSQGGSVWFINQSECVEGESGTSRFGQFAEIDAENEPCINITLDDVRKCGDNHFVFM
jgi:hypothetical protein